MNDMVNRTTNDIAPTSEEFVEAKKHGKRFVAMLFSTFGYIGQEYAFHFNTFAELDEDGVLPFDIIGIWDVNKQSRILGQQKS